MELVVDANVLFAALIKESQTRRMILSTGWTFFIPEYLLGEFNRHMGVLTDKTHLTREDLNQLFDEFLTTANIRIIPFTEFKRFFKEAERISPDPDDVHYFALAISKHCQIWSNDSRLKNQDKVKVHSTADLLESFSQKKSR